MASVAGRWTSVEHVVARVLRVARERLLLDLEKSMIVPILEIPAATDEPTVSAGSGRRWVSRDDERGRVRRLDVDAGSEDLAPQHQRQ